MPIADNLPPDLSRAIREKHLAVLCGAGLSMSPPSLVPSWSAFNGIIVEEICSLAASSVPSDVVPEIRAINPAKIPVQSLSDDIVNVFAGETYFQLLRFLDADETNANHNALAELAKSGVLKSNREIEIRRTEMVGGGRHRPRVLRGLLRSPAG